MSNGAAMDYDFGNKAQWRRTVWNEIERMGADKQGAVLFLGGKELMDVPVMERRGWARNNLICIERDKKTARSIRESGQLCVVGDARSVLRNWPSDLKISVLFFDYCNGLTSKENMVAEFEHVITHPALTGGVVGFNFMRGHDHQTNDIREIYQRNVAEFDDALAISHPPPKLGKVVISEHLATYGDLKKHRGLIYYYVYLNFMKGKAIESLRKFNPKRWDGLDGERQHRMVMGICQIMVPGSPTALSYQSTTNQIFDSIIFRTPPSVDRLPHTKDKPMARQIAAVLAHRTMRMNGKMRGGTQ